jgi:hypothetical protein
MIFSQATIRVVSQALTITMVLFTIDSVACSCDRVGIIKNKNEVDYVFKGKLKDITEVLTRDTATQTKEILKYQVTRYNFKVIRNYKGADGKETIELVQGMTDCSVRFEKDKTYIVYAYRDNSKLHYMLTDQKIEPYITTNLCTRTKHRNALTFWESFVLWLT